MPKRSVKDGGGSATGATGQSAKRGVASQEAVAHSIGLTVVASQATAVSVVGEFNDWNVERHPLQQVDSETWRITLQLAPGTYQYKFVIDGTQWEDDADNPKRAMNEFGTTNSILEVM